MGNGAFVTYGSVEEYNNAVKKANIALYNRYFDPESNRIRIRKLNDRYITPDYPPKGRKPIEPYDFINTWDKEGFGFNEK